MYMLYNLEFIIAENWIKLPIICRKEIRVLGRENNNMHQSLSVAYGRYHLIRDIDNTKNLKDLIDAREDYKRLIDIETNGSKDLDIKVKT